MQVNKQPTLLLAAMLLAGCAGLPDQQLARQAYQTGDLETATRNYQQLADMGYVDATVGLADIQAQSHDPRQQAQAEQTYRRAADKSPRAKSRLGRLLASKPGASVAEQREAEALLNEALDNGETGALVPLALLYLQYPNTWPQVNVQQRIDRWRQLGYPQAELAQIMVYRSQDTYAEHLAEIERICKAKLSEVDSCYVELATVNQLRGDRKAQQALIEQLKGDRLRGLVGSNRIESVAQVLADPQLGETDEKTAQALLEEIAPDYPAAWVSLAKLLYDYPALGDSAKMLDYLARGQDAAKPRADLLLGRLYYEGKWVPQDPKQAEMYLLKAAATEKDAHYFLGQLYRRGYLGDIAPQKAVDHLLIAARSGSVSADFALAQLFSQGKGVKAVPSNAYAFARLAQLHGAEHAGEVLATLQAQMNAQDLAQGERLLQQELHVRGAAWQAGAEAQALANGQEPEPQDTL